MHSITQNITDVRTKIAAAAQRAERSTDDVTLIAVSKGKSENDVRAAIESGQNVFGENRVQEAKAKFEKLRVDKKLTLHLIGPLQTNKTDEAVKLFDVIETLDRPKLADAMVDAIKKTGYAPQFYIEINTGNEPQKAGIAPDELGEFLSYCRDKCTLNVTGLMCIPPINEDPVPHFALLKRLADQHELKNISMGMSGDYEAAIRAGATAVRVGTAIFGSRD